MKSTAHHRLELGRFIWGGSAAPRRGEPAHHRSLLTTANALATEICMTPSSEKFTPAFGLGNPHLQTLWGPLWRLPPISNANANAYGWKTATFLTSTGMAQRDAQAPLVLVLHGLTGSSDSPM